ncbi:hypothetical protein NSMM_260107 [Nitrosomonas mobilis]|uniref:Uncharacterized protein n=1 Tax=Nitrosomonas mobilis TaxID=51642 RepID=A0A1G5SE38_9PROT|nr:hypothetical protein NSMM_260107 [Nitrosomonas mobilis]
MPLKPVQVSLSTEAQADTDAAIYWYIGEGPLITAEDFTEELGRTLDLLNQFAALGESGTHNTRLLPLHGFPLFPNLPASRRCCPRHHRCPSQPSARVLGWPTLRLRHLF